MESVRSDQPHTGYNQRILIFIKELQMLLHSLINQSVHMLSSSSGSRPKEHKGPKTRLQMKPSDGWNVILDCGWFAGSNSVHHVGCIVLMSDVTPHRVGPGILPCSFHAPCFHPHASLAKQKSAKQENIGC